MLQVFQHNVDTSLHLFFFNDVCLRCGLSLNNLQWGMFVPSETPKKLSPEHRNHLFYWLFHKNWCYVSRRLHIYRFFVPFFSSVQYTVLSLAADRSLLTLTLFITPTLPHRFIVDQGESLWATISCAPRRINATELVPPHQDTGTEGSRPSDACATVSSPLVSPNGRVTLFFPESVESISLLGSQIDAMHKISWRAASAFQRAVAMDIPWPSRKQSSTPVNAVCNLLHQRSWRCHDAQCHGIESSIECCHTACQFVDCSIHVNSELSSQQNVCFSRTLPQENEQFISGIVVWQIYG